MQRTTDPAEVLDNIPGLVVVLTAEGMLEFVNRRVREYFGLTLEELKGWITSEAIHPDDLSHTISTLRHAIKTGQPYRLDDRLRRSDGAYRWFHHDGIPIRDAEGRIVNWYVLFTDIHERKTAEDELQRSEQSLHEAQTLSHTGSWKIDVLSGAVVMTPEMARLCGVDYDHSWSFDELLSRIHPEDRERVQKLFERSVAQETNFQTDHRVVMPDGAIRYVHSIAHRVVNESGELVEFIGTTVDDTENWLAQAELERALKELRRSEEFLHEAQKMTHTGSWRLEVSSLAVTATPEMGRIFGVNLDDAPDPQHPTRSIRLELESGGAFFSQVHPDDRQRFEKAFERGLTQATDVQTEYRIVLPDGTTRHHRTVGHPVLNESAKLVEFFGTTVDDTEYWLAQTELEKALEQIKRLKDQLQDENLALREEITRSSMFEEIVGSSQPLRKVLEQVARVSRTDSTVLISGETGTGKELIARAIHKRSNRSARAFISVNCGAIPQSLIASELFGHEKGAFTGAIQRRIGCFEAANGGTIFLDEVGELPMETQVALLRILQEREFERVGGRERVKVDVRVLAATNRDLKRAVSSGSFRADLFYRLNVFPIEMPPLRDRVGDIPLLVEYLIDRFGKNAGKKFDSIAVKTFEMLQKYDWPGNVRELQNVIERAVIVCDGPLFSIDEMWLKPGETPAAIPALPVDATANDGEKELIERALVQSRGRVSGPSGAAAKLGIARQTLESKILRLGINKHQFRN